MFSNLTPPVFLAGALCRRGALLVGAGSWDDGVTGITRNKKMIIPVSVDKAAQAEAQGAGGGGGKDGQTATKGVCVPEWSMVELQGELVSKDPMSGQPLGSMTSENVSRTVWLEMYRA